MTPIRRCSTCSLEAHLEKDLEAFVKSPDSLYGRRNLCRKCAGAKTDNSSPSMKAAKRKNQAAKRYGVTLEEYERNMATSDCCQVCESKVNLCYDHCHTTGEFRGILCRSCNRSIGQLGDTLEALEAATEYLRRHYETD